MGVPWIRRLAGPSLLVLAGLVFLTLRAVPRIADGSQDLRHLHHVMNDESLILEHTWRMVERGDLDHGVRVYPGLYPYVTALVRLVSGAEAPAPTVIERTRWLSFGVMIVALLVPFVLFGLLLGSWWPPAIFTFFLSIHPETILWASRVHPDAFLFLFDHAAVACLGLAYGKKGRGWLWAATIFAGLSAGTKLFGLFIMVAIVAFIVWDGRKSPKQLVQQVALHGLLFLAVFVLTTPNIVLDPERTITGFVVQHHRNRHPISTSGWWPVLVGARGLGYAGMATIAIGVALFLFRRIRARKVDGLCFILFFGVFYLSFALFGVKLALPRYAAPALWPLFLLSLEELRPRGRLLAGARPVALLAVFVTVDWRAQLDALRAEDTHFARALTPERLEVGRQLESIAARHTGPVLTSFDAFVPVGVPWKHVWSLDDVTLPAEFSAIVVDGAFRKGRTFARLQRGELPFAATATIAGVVIYERQDALTPAGRPPRVRRRP